MTPPAQGLGGVLTRDREGSAPPELRVTGKGDLDQPWAGVAEVADKGTRPRPPAAAA